MILSAITWSTLIFVESAHGKYRLRLSVVLVFQRTQWYGSFKHTQARHIFNEQRKRNSTYSRAKVCPIDAPTLHQRQTTFWHIQDPRFPPTDEQKNFAIGDLISASYTF